MRALILGGGGIGSVLGGYLARGGREVTIADGWFQNVAAVRERGLIVQSVEGEFTVHPEFLHLDELGGYGAADVIVIAGKGYDTRAQAILAREHLHEGTIVMSAQNGMNDDEVGRWLGDHRMVACVVAMAADLVEAGVVRRTSAEESPSVVFGHLKQGRDRGVIESMGELFAPLGGIRLVDDAWPERWGKLTLNSMSNALAGLTGLWSDRMWSETLTLDVMIALGHETALVAREAGTVAAPVLGRISHALLLDADSVTGEAWATVAAHMRAISEQRVGLRANRASLLQDIMKGRRTEVEWLNGWIVRRGAELGIDTPTHAGMVEALRDVELGLRTSAIENASELASSVRTWYP